MAIVVELPRLSDTMEEGVVAKWRVAVGDKIKRGQVIAEMRSAGFDVVESVDTTFPKKLIVESRGRFFREIRGESLESLCVKGATIACRKH